MVKADAFLAEVLGLMDESTGSGLVGSVIRNGKTEEGVTPAVTTDTWAIPPVRRRFAGTLVCKRVELT
jgi:hypothetical protein